MYRGRTDHFPPGFLRRNELSFPARGQPCRRGYFPALLQKPGGQSGKSSLSDGSIHGIMSIAGAQDGEQGHSIFSGNFIRPVHDGEIKAPLFRLQQAPVTGGLRIPPVPNQTAAHRRKSGIQLVRTSSGSAEPAFPRFVPAGRNHHISRPKIDRNTELPVQINRTGNITTDHGKIPFIRSRNRIHRALNAICAEPLCRILKHRKLSHSRFQREFSQRETFDLFSLDRLRRIPAVFRPNAQLQRDLQFFSCIIHCGQTDCTVCPSLFSDKAALFGERSNLHRGARNPVCSFPSSHLHVVQPEGCTFILHPMAGLQSDNIPGAFPFP